MIALLPALLPALLALAGLVAPPTADAAASARVTVNGRAVSVAQTGRDFDVQFASLSLAPGASQRFTFDYAISVEDGGLPVSPDASTVALVQQCLGTTPASCGPAFTGFETARASLTLLGLDPRGANPFLSVTADAPLVVTLETPADSFAQRLTQSGTVHVVVSNTSTDFGLSTTVPLTLAATWAYAAPVPEPQSWLGLLLGLPLVAWARRRHAGAKTARGRSRDVSGGPGARRQDTRMRPLLFFMESRT